MSIARAALRGTTSRTQARTAAALRLAAASWLLVCASASADPRVPASGVIGVEPAHLDADHWIARQPHADRVRFDDDAIAAQNARLVAVDDAVQSLADLPATMTAEDIARRVQGLSRAPSRPLFDERGERVRGAAIARLLDAANLDAIADTAPRFGLVTHRADLRTFPTAQRVFSSADDRDIDRFQESALFPGTPVAVLHESRDGQWWFVASARYDAWIERRHVALGEREVVLGYGAKSPYLVVTGAKVDTVFNPERPEISELQLDMGVRVPLRADWPADAPVNGQHPYASWVIELPVHGDDGRLELVPALLPKTADVSTDYLPHTAANVIRQGFKFLGERYGWGHAYNARDCSGFVSEVYRSMGIELPRNTSAQSVSAAFDRIAFDGDDGIDARLAVLRTLEPGDLIYIPGHVMMAIGQHDGGPYVIHDTTGITYFDARGELVRLPLNSVSVTPLLPLQSDADTRTIERITSIQRIRPVIDGDGKPAEDVPAR